MPYREDEDAAVARADALQVELDVAHRKLEGHRHDDPFADTPVVRADAEPPVVEPAPAPVPVVLRSSTPAPPVPIGPRPQAGALLAILLIVAVLAGIAFAIVAFATS